MTTPTSPTRAALRRVKIPIFFVDALLSATIGLLLATSAAQLHALSGGGLAPETLRFVGLALLPWSFHNWITSRERPLRLTSFCIHVIVDSFWILASLWIYAHHFRSFTAVGHVSYGPQIATVALVLFLKIQAFRERDTRRTA